MNRATDTSAEDEASPHPTFLISYAQNLEDVLLHRALSGVERGFYVDVGAQDPIMDSVTKAFYDRGWRGINVEPVRHWYEKLSADRPEDLNLECALGAETGSLTLYDIPNSGLSTTVPEIAEEHRRQGYEVLEREVGIDTLDAVFARHQIRTVHFLKVDVEGAEADVLRGLSLDAVRPWIIVVEATMPNSQIPTHHEWEHLLTERSYAFVWFDGLNRFYVANEHPELKGAFHTQPNVFDHYRLYTESAALAWAGSLQAELEERGVERGALQARIDEQGAELERLAAEAKQLSGTLAASERALEREKSLAGHLSERFASMIAGLQREAEAFRAQAENWRRIAEEQRVLMDRLEALSREASNVRPEMPQQLARTLELERTIQQLQDEISAIRRSTSWRVTAPLRGLKTAWRKLIRPGAQDHGPAMDSWEALRQLGLRAADNPRLRKPAAAFLARHPALKRRMLDILLKRTPPSPPPSPPVWASRPATTSTGQTSAPAIPAPDTAISAGQRTVWNALARTRASSDRPPMEY